MNIKTWWVITWQMQIHLECWLPITVIILHSMLAIRQKWVEMFLQNSTKCCYLMMIIWIHCGKIKRKLFFKTISNIFSRKIFIAFLKGLHKPTADLNFDLFSKNEESWMLNVFLVKSSFSSAQIKQNSVFKIQKSTLLCTHAQSGGLILKYYNLSWIYTCTALLNFPRHYLPDVHVRTKKSNSWIWIWCDELLCLICILFIMWETIKMGTVELQSLSQEHVALVQIQVQDANALTLITTDFYFHDYNRKHNIMCKNVIKC